jgi:hypothetical protein
MASAVIRYVGLSGVVLAGLVYVTGYEQVSAAGDPTDQVTWWRRDVFGLATRLV